MRYITHLTRLSWWAAVSLLVPVLFSAPIIINLVIGLFPQPVHHTTTDEANPVIASLFTPEVQYWQSDIATWAAEYSVDPTIIATIMQIESCGHPTVASHAGAQGLFQVMPFHFTTGENMLDPNTNAYRSTNFIKECQNYSNNDIGLTLACYNGGPSVVNRPFHTWASETQRYYVWGLGIYLDAMEFAQESQTLDNWLQAGGSSLCTRAAAAQGFQQARAD